MPGETDCDGGRANAATRAKHRDHLANLLGCDGRVGARDQRDQAAEQLSCERFHDVIGDTCMDEIAVKPDLVAIAYSDDLNTGLANVRELPDLCQRQFDIADI